MAEDDEDATVTAGTGCHGMPPVYKYYLVTKYMLERGHKLFK